MACAAISTDPNQPIKKSATQNPQHSMATCMPAGKQSWIKIRQALCSPIPSFGQEGKSFLDVTHKPTHMNTWHSTVDQAQQLRDQLAAVALERDGLRQQQASAQRRHGELTDLGQAELKARLDKCVQDHRTALVAGQFAEATVLAETSQKLTATLRDASESESTALWRGS